MSLHLVAEESAGGLTPDQKAMLVSATRVMLGQCRSMVDECERDLAWEKIYGSKPERLREAEEFLLLAHESAANWAELLSVLP